MYIQLFTWYLHLEFSEELQKCSVYTDEVIFSPKLGFSFWAPVLVNASSIHSDA